jgi:hypothetical protein
MTYADHILSFYKNLQIKYALPKGVVILNPYLDSEDFSFCSEFYRKFYNDENERTLILGINPGRHGGGITGVPFTDPIKLERYCKIQNPFSKKPELSADFVYTMIENFGGAREFYNKFYISAVSPLGFTLNGKNLNYYDSKELQLSLKSFMVDALTKQISFGINRDVCYCLGEGENFKFLSRLNSEFQFFQKIVPLAHPRFIMQYRRKKVMEYVNEYLTKFGVDHALARNIIPAEKDVVNSTFDSKL